MLPTGAAFKEHGWQPTFSDVVEFMDTVVELGLPGCNFWEYGNAKAYVPELYSAIAAYDLESGTALEAPEIPEEPEETEEPVVIPVSGPTAIEVVGRARGDSCKRSQCARRTQGARRCTLVYHVAPDRG